MRHEFCFVTEEVIMYYFRVGISLLYYTCVHNVCEYIQSTHWLVPGYCLGQISRLERSTTTTARNLGIEDSSHAKIGVIQVSCSCGKWSPIDADEPQIASAINH